MLERNQVSGIVVGGSQALIEATLLRETSPSGGRFGHGVLARVGNDGTTPANVTLRGSLVEGNHEAGVIAVGADLCLEATVVSETQPSQAGFGDGVTVAYLMVPASLTIIDSQIEHNQRAGVSNFGSTVTIGSTGIDCHPIDLDGETYKQLSAVFSDLGGNDCEHGHAS